MAGPMAGRVMAPRSCAMSAARAAGRLRCRSTKRSATGASRKFRIAMSDEYRYIIVGGGIVGAAVGFHLAAHGSVCLLEQESAAGYHSTGRSAALLSENYGTPLIQKLTARARSFLESPPAGFAAHPLLVARGMVYVGGKKEGDALDRVLRSGQSVVPGIHRISQAEVLKLCPVLKPSIAYAGVYEPDARDVDVEGLLQGYLDRKSTRLNSSHTVISYAVFCL